jgi:hypothetical protein
MEEIFNKSKLEVNEVLSKVEDDKNSTKTSETNTKQIFHEQSNFLYLVIFYSYSYKHDYILKSKQD